MWLAVAGLVRHTCSTHGQTPLQVVHTFLFFNGLLGLIVLSTCHSVVVNIAGWKFFFFLNSTKCMTVEMQCVAS